MGLEIEEEPVWCPLMMESLVGEKKSFHRKRKQQTQKTIPWTMVGCGDETKWARDGRCRLKAGRLATGERDWKDHLWLCRRGTLKGQWWFGSGMWGS